jgi:hypothetical protein
MQTQTFDMTFDILIDELKKIYILFYILIEFSVRKHRHSIFQLCVLVCNKQTSDILIQFLFCKHNFLSLLLSRKQTPVVTVIQNGSMVCITNNGAAKTS